MLREQKLSRSEKSGPVQVSYLNPAKTYSSQNNGSQPGLHAPKQTQARAGAGISPLHREKERPPPTSTEDAAKFREIMEGLKNTSLSWPVLSLSHVFTVFHSHFCYPTQDTYSTKSSLNSCKYPNPAKSSKFLQILPYFKSNTLFCHLWKYLYSLKYTLVSQSLLLIIIIFS